MDRKIQVLIILGATLFGLCATPCRAQQQPQPEKIERGVTVEPNSEEKGDRVPAPQYALAGLATIALLVILCKPSRKAYHE